MKIDKDVLDVLNNAECEGNNLFLTSQMDRSHYVKINKVLEALGGKWNKKLKCHVFGSGAKEKIREAVESESFEDAKADFNFFPTPQNIVDDMVYHRARITKGMRVLEPEAGRGNIALEAQKAGGVVDCFELMENNYKTLLDKGFNSVVQADFLTVTPNPIYDRIIMNPPFARQQDIKHIQHALQFLKPDGVLISVMSASVEFRSNKLTTEFRKMIEDKGGYIEELPSESFKESGTKVNTCLVCIPA